MITTTIFCILILFAPTLWGQDTNPLPTCPPKYVEMLKAMKQKKIGNSLTCADIDDIDKQAPLTIDNDGNWHFKEELKTRTELLKKHGIKPPKVFLVYGFLEYKPKKGPTRLLVIGFNNEKSKYSDWPLIATTQKNKDSEGNIYPINIRIGERSSFNDILIYRSGKSGKYGKAYQALAAPWSSDTWTADVKRPGIASECLACQGWLCGKDPVICFSDFNDNGRLEYIINHSEMNFSGPYVAEEKSNGDFKTLIQGGDNPGEIKKHNGQWVYVGTTTCEGPWEYCGIGYANCTRPTVHRYNPKAEEFEPDENLTNHFHPIKEIPYPQGCNQTLSDDTLISSKEGNTWFRLKPAPKKQNK